MAHLYNVLQGEIEGSQLHTQLMATAKHYFTSEILHKKKNTCDNMWVKCME